KNAFTNLQDSTNGKGGAIYFDGDSLSVINCNIAQCFARHGAGIFCTESTKYILIDSCNISDNESLYYGGGIASYGDYNELFIRNSQIMRNEGSQGGGVYCLSNTSRTSAIHISNSEISHNTNIAVLNFPFDSALITIDNSILNYNYGGGVYQEISNTSDTGYCIITAKNSIFKGDSIRGALRNYSWSDYRNCFTTVTVDSCMFLNNGADYGGGIHNFAAVHEATPSYKQVIAKVEVRNSLIDSTRAYRGGAIYNQGGTNAGFADVAPLQVKTIVSNSTISNCRAATSGAGIFSSLRYSSGNAVDSLIIHNSTIANCSANDFGGAAYVGRYLPSGTHKVRIKITNSSIIGNQASSGGGIYYKPTDTSSIIKCRSSIMAFNKNGNMVRDAIPAGNVYQSLGYNILSDSNIFGITGGDYLGVDSIQLNLSVLQNNGGLHPTMVPLPGSLAINNGNPTDFSDAQNGPINGIRDIGAADYNNNVTFLSAAEGINDLSIYPNPTNTFINIDAVRDALYYVMYNSAGQIILEGKERKIDVQTFQPGLYIIKTLQHGAHKIIVQ
ncbi:MAG: T9SS type A sorting domain-containing protein, partial [Flavobacteriales bacterium]|nr:T9SS type A sorting domain-containing protein [Flavobacteriales bacterium]